MEQREIDEMYMRRCLQLARCGRPGAAPNPMVGAVVVCDGRIIGEGYHRQCGGPHAEVNAIASVSEGDQPLLRQSTLYVSLEPCAHYGKTPPCAQLIIDRGIPRVVVGCRDPFARVDGRGIAMLREAGVEVRVGVLEQECLWLNRRFITFHTQHRPYITLKWAQSEDGYIDRLRECADVPPVHFSTPLTQALVHKLRARNEAILVGRRTWELDRPSLTVRLWNGRNPMRVVLGGGKWTIDGADGRSETATQPSDGLIRALMAELYERGVQTLLVEGGAHTLQGFIDAGVWDEARVETAPLILGEGVRAPEIGGKCVKKLLIDGHSITHIYKNS
ncbi:MAG: bifunctional diaminohydroxyphosphoribosylaminopyrimidine deaminase/5-amino-6-(5-phosphoribosylamino)uracil reductase RibD [Bacteroidaceae bacterium]|nr:bifunctional diaminohydroxyphosphoribosylaminopyrimidine deaminase/5-amino-6-(5-phosphoribosylamino)uracil reductase RibD [Bacteroidaceae bacterium]